MIGSGVSSMLLIWIIDVEGPDVERWRCATSAKRTLLFPEPLWPSTRVAILRNYAFLLERWRRRIGSIKAGPFSELVLQGFDQRAVCLRVNAHCMRSEPPSPAQLFSNMQRFIRGFEVCCVATSPSKIQPNIVAIDGAIGSWEKQLHASLLDFISLPIVSPPQRLVMSEATNSMGLFSKT